MQLSGRLSQVVRGVCFAHLSAMPLIRNKGDQNQLFVQCFYVHSKSKGSELLIRHYNYGKNIIMSRGFPMVLIIVVRSLF